ncbi:MAG: ComEC/Rec2 family competence protein [Bacteroidales bacterium]
MRNSELMKGFRSAPFIRILLPLVAGVVGHTSVYALPFCATFFCALCLLAMLLAYHFSTSYFRLWIFGVCANAFLFFAGIALVQGLKKSSDLPFDKRVHVVAIVTDVLSISSSVAKLNLHLLAYEDSLEWKHADEKAILYLRVDTSKLPQIGDKLLVSASFSRIPPPQNPHEFDYAHYQQQQGVFASAFADSKTCKIVAHNCLGQHKIFPKMLREKALRFFDEQGIHGEEFAVLQALTLGDKSLLDTDLRTAYASAGAMHILAVSGLHVGIISMILGFLLRPFEQRKRGRILRGIVILLCMWTYALIAGLSASVLRATIMFSVLTIGGMLNRSTNTYNTLAFSAFLIALFDPLCFYDTGFQLSYAAVLSILFFQPRIYKILYFKTYIGDALWSLVAVSLAANIGTLPITLLMFHQIPVYFILTNILVTIPTILVMGGFLASLAFSWFPPFSWLLVMGTKYSIVGLNFCIRLVEGLPYSLIEGLWITPLQAFLLVAIIISLAFFIWIKRNAFILVCLLALACFLGIRVYYKYDVYHQKKIIVHAVKNTSIITFIDGKAGFSLCDSAHLQHNFDFNLKNHFVSMGFASADKIPRVSLQQSANIELPNYGVHKNFVHFAGKTLKISVNERVVKLSSPIPVDYLILTSLCKMNAQELLQMYAPKQIILDASVPHYAARRYLKTFEQHNIALYNVRQQGAFVHKL